MSYDIKLTDSQSHVVMELPAGMFVRSGNICAEIDEITGDFYQVPQKEASVNITYNYSGYYYEACEGDQRFYNDGKNLGIRAIYGRTAKESIPMLIDMIERIKKRYQNADGSWKLGNRTRQFAINAKGEKIIDLYEIMLQGLTPVVEHYQVSEDDTSDYWEETAANSIIPLQTMLIFAVNLEDKDCIWNGD